MLGDQEATYGDILRFNRIRNEDILRFNRIKNEDILKKAEVALIE